MYLFGLPLLVIKDLWIFLLFTLSLSSEQGGEAVGLYSVLAENSIYLVKSDYLTTCSQTPSNECKSVFWWINK